MEEPLHGQRIGAYRIIRQLGAGGMGEVYEAEHVALGVRRALKVFSTESEHVEFLRKRFIDEGRILAAFQHPRIVRVYNLVVDEESDKAYFEMDLVLSPTGQPRTLADEQRDGISEDKIVGWFKDICEGLAYIHSQGVVHRDISLDNILIGSDGRAVITDFGIAKIIDDSFRKRIDMTVTVVSKDGSKLRMGKGLYMAPELKEGGKATFASDAYAVGVILFRLLTGAWYAPGTNLDLLPNFKYDWRPVISRLCNVDPEKRLGEGGIAALPSLLNRVDLEMEESSPLQADHVLQPGIADSADHAANHVPFWRWKWIALGGALLAIIVVICGVRLFMEGVHEKAVDVQHDNFSGRDNVDMEKCIVTLNGVELRADLTIDKNTGSKFVKVVSVRNANGDFAIPEKVYGCTVTSIGDSAFRNSYGLTSLEIPIGVKSIGGEAFLGCTNLTSVTIPHSVESIGNDAFRNCCMLAKIAIPNSVKELGFGVLGFCDNLAEISIDDDNKNYCLRDGMLLTKDGKILIAAIPLRGKTNVIVPDGVTVIGKAAFSSCCNITDINIPGSVTNIGDSAFAGGVNAFRVADDNPNYKSVSDLLLTKDGEALVRGVNGVVEIPSSVTSIGDKAFQHCYGLTNVVVSDNVTSIGNYAFRSCSALENVTIPDGVMEIGAWAFSNCRNLKGVIISDSVERIGVCAFSGCSGLKSARLSHGIESIAEKMFQGCSSLTAVTIPDGVMEIGSQVFFGCTNLASVTIPRSVDSIRKDAFDKTALNTVYVSSGDADRVKKLFFDSGHDVERIKFVESETTPGSSAN